MVVKVLLCFLLALVASGFSTPAAAGDSPKEGDEYFEKQIRPLLVTHCLECHGDKKPQGGFRLTSRALLLKGGETGPAVVPNKPDESKLIRAIGYIDELKMPPKQKLPEGDIAKFKHWVSLGAPWPAGSASVEGDAAAGMPVTEKHKTWWAFQPVRITAPGQSSAWSQNPIDDFVLAELTSRKLTTSGAADRRTWLRRVTFDLTGLPPSVENLDEFAADQSDQAYERVVDQLLASPAYGQHWTRHWLDIVRYADYHDADAKARDHNCEPLNAWRYRDWVVESFNRDLPFDQFIVHQIAGDLLPVPEGRDFYADGLIATTFLSNGTWDRGDADKEKMVSDMVDDNVDTIGKAFMGLTLGCARCHDHKFDPISQSDYYGLAGVFYSTRILKELGAKGAEYKLNRVPLVDKSYVEQRDEQLRQIKEAEAKVAELDKRVPKLPDDDPERKEVVGLRDKLKRELLAEPPLTDAASEGGTPGGLFPGIQDVPIHIRGSYTRLGAVVPRRMPTFFAGEAQAPISKESGRREVAAWVASKQNPLTARVIVNRVWQWHFGEGLVRTPNNFGLLSEPPSHPALLDWLANGFVQQGWSLKKLHRQIVLSATYRQRSDVLGDVIDRDPENRWLGRFTARRLEAEALRDATLAATGLLDLTLGGPASADLSVPRRSLYIQTSRWDRGNFSTLFDAANPDASVEARAVSTVAPQALFLLNNSFQLDQAKLLAERLGRDAPDGSDSERPRIQRAYRVLFGRLPTDEELAIAMGIVQGNAGGDGWIDLAHVLLCCNEFVYVD